MSLTPVWVEKEPMRMTWAPDVHMSRPWTPNVHMRSPWATVVPMTMSWDVPIPIITHVVSHTNEKHTSYCLEIVFEHCREVLKMHKHNN